MYNDAVDRHSIVFHVQPKIGFHYLHTKPVGHACTCMLYPSELVVPVIIAKYIPIRRI